METKILEKKIRSEKVQPPGAPAVTPEIREAIGDGFEEYRRQIAEIRASHGKQIRKSILN